MQEILNQVRAKQLTANQAKEQLLTLAVNGDITVQQALAAQSEVEALASEKALTFKVSEKGAVSVYGLQRFPVSLYKGQWSRLLDNADNLRKFLLSHPELSDRKAAA